MAEDVVAILHQRFDHLPGRAALVTREVAVHAVLDPPVQGRECRVAPVRMLELLPEMPERMRLAGRIALGGEVAGELAEHRDPVTERGQGQLPQRLIDLLDPRAAPLDRLDIRRHGRGRDKLDQRLEQEIRVVVPAPGALVAVRPAIELRQGEREPDQIVALKLRCHALAPAFRRAWWC